MTLPDDFKLKIGSAIILGNAGTHSPAAANNLGAITDEINVTNLAAGAARQSAKFDFGATFDEIQTLAACVEWETNPEVANTDYLEFYMGFSPLAAAANANPGGLSGSDAAYTGYAAGSLAASLRQLTPLGVMMMDNVINTDQAQIDTDIYTFRPSERYGILVVVNKANAAALHSDVIETSFRIGSRVTHMVD